MMTGTRATGEPAVASRTRVRPQVVCVGNIVADIVPRPMPRLPEPGELTLNDQTRINLGGCGATTAAALTRLGVETALVTAVGRDCLGDFAIAELGRLGVDTSRVAVLHDQETSKNIILLVDGQDRRYIYTMGATAALRARDIDLDGVRASDLLFVGAYLLIPNLVQEELLAVFREARAAGVRTALDVAAVRSDTHHRSLEKLLAQTDYFFPNQDEAQIITRTRDPQAQALRFRQMGVSTAVITCGADGATMANKEGLFTIGTHPGRVVDGTGAGDCFDAAFIFALMEGKADTDALRWGSALGATCVRSVGGTEGLMTRSELEAFAQSHPLEIEAR